MVYSEEKYFVLGRLEQPRHDKNLLYQPSEPNEPSKEDYVTSSYVLLESRFASVSTVSRGQPSLDYLDETENQEEAGDNKRKGGHTCLYIFVWLRC
jgi:hypothetical protein